MEACSRVSLSTFVMWKNFLIPLIAFILDLHTATGKVDFSWVPQMGNSLESSENGFVRRSNGSEHFGLKGRSLAGGLRGGGDTEGDACSAHDGDAISCRRSPICYYNCADHTCNDDSKRKPNPCPKCSQFCQDVCACKMSELNCQYDVQDGNCRPTNPSGGGSTGGLRPCHCVEFENLECGRKGEKYVFDGQICQNTEDRGICAISEVIVAVNHGGNEEALLPTGILHKADFEVEYIDPFETRLPLKLENIPGLSPGEQTLFSTIVVGKSEKRGKDRCLSYLIPLCEDGWHELALHFIDHHSKGPGKRLFNVWFNELLIIPELDIYRTVGAMSKPLTIHQNFRIVKKATIIKIKGHPDTYIPDKGQVKLSFCYSDCEKVKDGNYVSAGFSVVRFVSDKDVFRRQSELPRARQVPNDYVKAINNTTPLECIQHAGNHCGCKQAGCEVNVAHGSCVPLRVCGEKSDQCEEVARSAKCRRANVFYIRGGALCYNDKQSGDCNVKKVISGTKTFVPRGAYKDSRGVVYYAEKVYEDPGQVRTFDPEDVQLKMCKWPANVPDIYLWQTQIYGLYRSQDKGCLTYPLGNMENPGQYEISLKFLENYCPADTSCRSFVVKMNNLTLLNEIFVASYVGKCQPMEAIASIEVTKENGGIWVGVEGYPPFKQGKEGIRLSFCYGKCGSIHDFIISAFYLAQVGG